MAAAQAGPREWAQEFSTEQNFNNAWGDGPNSSAYPQQQQNLKWSVEYLTESENSKFQNLNDDGRSWNDEFMNFVQKVDNGEIKLPENGSTSDQMTRGEDYWNQLEDQWDTMAKQNDDHQWLTEYNDLTHMYKDYQLQDNNPYSEIDDPLSEGKRLLAAGELSGAILCFEASVKKMPENAESWQYLGVAQAENEQEPKTIAALQKCLDLDPKNLTALQSLAIAYTNESLYDAACRTLARWLGSNERYSYLAPNIDLAKFRPSSFVDRDLFKSVEDAFLQATQQSSQVDPDLQNVFGVLYNLSGDLERAIDCFQVALMVKPDDARLWNRLGATLANNSRSADAVSAYRKALELYPAFVRARYNLGISCLNLGSHWQAVEHFVSALSLQNNGVGPSGKADMSYGIWGTLRVAAMGLKSDEFLNMIDAKDFDAIRNFLSNRSNSSVLPPQTYVD
jgi:peroxin-5